MSDHQDPPLITEDPETVVRDAHAYTVRHLAELRAQRDELNARIRNMVADENVLARAVRAFDKAHATRKKTDREVIRGDFATFDPDAISDREPLTFVPNTED